MENLSSLPDVNDVKICVVGLGYVGLPLAAEFSKVFSVVGYDCDDGRISELNLFHDRTNELSNDSLRQLKNIHFTSAIEGIEYCNCYIITVPTPVDTQNKPDITSLLSASKSVAKLLKCGDVVVFESTVYPGATEYECVNELERWSELKLSSSVSDNTSGVFHLGFSPERVNPGDKARGVADILKIVAGNTTATTDFLGELYGKIIKSGVYKAPSIKVAEAAKVVENIQRDLNIALINEISIVCNLLEIDTEEVLLAAETKWNFIPFRPGLVGGHCIGVDPYYLLHKAYQLGFSPELIQAGRKVNESMSFYVASRIIKAMLKKKIEVVASKVLILGAAFKENCPDTRNSKVFDLYDNLGDYGCEVHIYDPVVVELPNDKKDNYFMVRNLSQSYYDCIVLAVNHDEFSSLTGSSVVKFGKARHVLFDMKYTFEKTLVDERL